MAVGGAYLQRLLRRLAMLCRRQHSLGAFALPAELILMIATHLPDASVISLALTCRTLHSLCFPRHPHLNPSEKQELLLMLERDMLHVVFCHSCVALHRWDPRSGFPGRTRHLACKQFGVVHHLCTCYIPYHRARLVMNRHFYRSPHGMPLRRVEQRYRSRQPQEGITQSDSTHARIIDDNLLVLSVKTMCQSGGDAKALRHYVDSGIYDVCRHLSLAKGNPDYAPTQIPELAKDATTPNYFAPMASLDSIHERRTAHPLEYRPGVVRDRWIKADGIQGTTQSEWVDVPGLVKYARITNSVAARLDNAPVLTNDRNRTGPNVWTDFHTLFYRNRSTQT
ncbi:hypothetical protein BDV95DRAFT_589675 [Massariosphaeria phaeospora]|uniref:F-box domain-containing protein n=1 Tax=Massariosphaeria phaeospora TaxID=100035 RepID=A0A7C8II78_9PLEO|nr:hypothetical protein BDV95DRAFT_589675 [Massariosphaeria phaeospora]